MAQKYEINGTVNSLTDLISPNRRLGAVSEAPGGAYRFVDILSDPETDPPVGYQWLTVITEAEHAPAITLTSGEKRVTAWWAHGTGHIAVRRAGVTTEEVLALDGSQPDLVHAFHDGDSLVIVNDGEGDLVVGNEIFPEYADTDEVRATPEIAEALLATQGLVGQLQ